jgi:cytochrome c oxidase subunit 2
MTPACLSSCSWLLPCLAWADAPLQSMVHPAGPAAAEISRLWWVMCGAFTGVFVLVMVLVAIAIWQRPPHGSVPTRTQPPWGKTGFIVAGGVIFPFVVITPLYLYSLVTSARIQPPESSLTVQVRGRMWWWEVRYPDGNIVTANEIHIPAGVPVKLELTSADVIHSFWVPRLHGKRDMVPGLKNTFWIQADQPGVYRGQCGEYCGTQHANMAFEVIALEPAAFDAWRAERLQSAESATDTSQRGKEVFFRAGCPQCHAIRDTPATGNAGPDLTHLASRRMVGGALAPNTRGNLAGWVADPQGMKPGVKMPRTYLAAQDLQDLVSYLETLR